MILPMTSSSDYLRLLALLRLASPALPIGGFSYSQGLETAVEQGWITGESTTQIWLADLLRYNLGRFEAPLLGQLCATVKADDWMQARRLNARYLASRESAELRAETLQMGYSLWQLLLSLPEMQTQHEAIQAALQDLLNEETEQTQLSLPLVWSIAARCFDLGAAEALTGYVWAWLENQIMAALKAVPLGQQAGQRLFSALLPMVAAVVEQALTLPEKAWSNTAPGFAMATSWHESQYSRLFRS